MRMTTKLLASCAIAATFLVAPVLGTLSAKAATIDWANWSNTYTASSATATIGSNSVTYTGTLNSVVANYPSWLPASTFSGGTVGNAPPQSGGIVQLFGGDSTVDTITFASAVLNPVIAIWSLGQGDINASFAFNAPFTIESGGPSIEYTGSSITSLGNTVYGVEGNGTIMFFGTFTSISWTNPVFENWYGFTVGTSETPLPAALPLFASGLGALGLLGWRRKRKTQAAA